MWYTILRRKGGTSYFERWVCRLFMCFWTICISAALVSPPLYTKNYQPNIADSLKKSYLVNLTNLPGSIPSKSEKGIFVFPSLML